MPLSTAPDPYMEMTDDPLQRGNYEHYRNKVLTEPDKVQDFYDKYSTVRKSIQSINAWGKESLNTPDLLGPFLADHGFDFEKKETSDEQNLSEVAA